MSGDEYRKYACDYLGLGFADVNTVTNNPKKMFHCLGHFRIIDSETVGQKVTNARLTRVIEYAKFTKPPLERTSVQWWQYDAQKQAELQEIKDDWEEKYIRHLFMSFADYKISCKASSNPPPNPNRDAENFEAKAVRMFREKLFKRHEHTPDWKGYKTYLKQAAPALYKLLNEKIPAYFPEQERRTHSYVVGTTGSGKSELLKLIAYSYLRFPDYGSVVIVDPKGDLALQVASWNENSTTDRLIYIDPFLHPDFTPTINPFDVRSNSEQQKRLIAQELLNALAEILKSDTGADFSLNMRALLMPCILVLLDLPTSSIKDLHRFMIAETNSDLIDFALENGSDDIKAFFSDEFGAPGYKITKHAIATKLRLLLSTGTFADLTCGRSTIDLERAMNEKKLIVFNLSKGTVGEDESRAFGKLVVALMQAFAQRRTAIDERYRVPTHLIVDEFQNFVTRSIGTILEEARGMKVYLTLAQLSVGSGMSDELERTVLNMTNVKYIGRSETTEERKTANVIGVEASDISALSVGEFFARSGRNPAFKFQTRTDILDKKNAMTIKAWAVVCGQQIDLHYRRKNKPDMPTQKTHRPLKSNPEPSEIFGTPIKPKRKLI